ncbi:hypothetical protein M2347_001572 [Chryseobacterium sp. H1D6B]|uniref:hypothetical protein n=1 Tax=Chryseobacterium sp. H1D6B TaxID=2940588 RepID=UPI0015C7A486|nr:hypothetical protein [Chryseobacterium sp. H1D6B]MDH6251845.1 hypothetical protein [Chryseobacterium sp. H1D6B]
MKKLFIIGAAALGTVVSAFPFRTSCGKVLMVNQEGIQGMSYGEVINTLKLMNGAACGTTNVSVTVYNH